MHYSYFRGGSLASPDGAPRDQMVSGFSISAPLPDVLGYSCSGLGGSGTRHARWRCKSEQGGEGRAAVITVVVTTPMSFV